MKKLIALFLFVLLILSSCTYFNEQELFPNEVCDTSNITYSANILPIFQQFCYRCHSASSGVIRGNFNLEDFSNIQREVSNGQLLNNIKHDPAGIPMPQGDAKLSDCNINKIENWINNGTLQN